MHGSSSSRKRPVVFSDHDSDPDICEEFSQTIEEFQEVPAQSSHSSDISCNQKRKKSRVVKTEEDQVPLPDPFPLPKNFRTDVDIALRNKKMNAATRSSFISSVAHSILMFKKYPNQRDYRVVSSAVLKAYPFLKSPIGDPDVRHDYFYILLSGCYYRIVKEEND